MKQYSMYRKYGKRIVDITCALAALGIFWWLYIVVAVLVRVKLGSPVLFKQKRPGLNEHIFEMYKFRTMAEKYDQNGNLLPDDLRLTKFGKRLRATSLDELPEVFNILKGDMSVIGPRPQLVKDMVFMTEEQRRRHTVRPGLSGLAQVNGRNAITWERKLEYDLAYINKITFWSDIKLIFKTIQKAILKKEGITGTDMFTAEDYGEYLLRTGKIREEEFENNIKRAALLLKRGTEMEQVKTCR